MPLEKYNANADKYTGAALPKLVANTKLIVLNEDEAAVSKQAAVLRWAYFCFGMGLVYTLVTFALQL